jgi:hypothetical protein
MIETYVWEKPRGIIKYKEKDYMIIYKKGYLTIGCQCFKDCTCSKDNKIKDVELYRVCGKNRHDRVPHPQNFNTFEEAMDRVNTLKEST